MLINQDFSVDRSKYLGGSDIGAILGLSPYRTPLQVWMEKTGKEVIKLDSLPLRFGTFAEEFVANEYARATHSTLLHDESIYIHPEHDYMSAHIDRFVLGDGPNTLPSKILECKTANPFSSGDWGDAGSDQIPMSYLCQCVWYMAITNLDKTDLAVLFGNSDFRIYTIERDVDLEKLILEKAAHFWSHHVLSDTPPPAVNEHDCHSLFPIGNASQTVEADINTYELIKQLHQLNIEMKERETQISNIKQGLMQFMGNAEQLTYEGNILATWKAPKVSYRLDTKALEAQYPDICSQYKVGIQNSRRFTIKESSFFEGAI